MDILQAIILGIVEGISEFLPVSSTGHLILTSELLKIPSSDFLSSFEISIQLGAILSVVVIYAKKILSQKKLIMTILAAFLPTAIIGLVLYKFVKNYLLDSPTVVVWSLFLGGLALIIFELSHKEKPEAVKDAEDINFKQAMAIGLFQCLAMIPGVSRSAATVVGGLTLGLSRKAIVEFSFLLAIPTMCAASGFDLLKTGFSFNAHEWLLLAAGFITAFIVAWFCVKWLLKFIQNHTFIPFGIYRIIIAAVFWLMLLK
jgi:undecaprenyl-diphosphatase